MKKYSHDYRKVSRADLLLQEAQIRIRYDNYYEAEKRVEEAHMLLQEYLSQDKDNMVEDDDVENGWVRYNDAARELEDAHRLNAHYRETLLAQGRAALEVTRRSEENLAEQEELGPRRKTVPKSERHKGIDSRFLKRQAEGADASNPLYDKVVVMSGTFEQIGMERDRVAEAIQRLGAKLNRGIGPTVSVFVTGNKPGPSKLKEVESMRAAGRDIRIVSQLELKEIIDKYLPKEG